MAWQHWRYIWRNFVNICLVLCAVCAITNVNSISAADVNPDNPIDDVVSVPISGQRSVEDGEDEHASGVYGLPGTQHELRFEVGGGSSQCLFQYLKAGADLHTTFRVVRGVDNNINMEIRNSYGGLIDAAQWTNEGNFDKTINESGIYSFCFDNSMSMFSSKLIYFYMLSYIEQDWRNYATEIQDFNIEVTNFTSMLESVDQSTNKVKMFQAMSRSQAMKDWYTIKGNNTFVGRLSIIMCVVIILTSVFQVFFVRRLFNTSGSGVQSKSKPRA